MRTRLSTMLGIAVTAAWMAGTAPLAWAQEERTIQGEIVDPAAYLKAGSRGPEAANQTYEAVDGGQTLALLEEATGQLYLLLAEEPGEDPNELVYDYVNQTLKVTGTVYARAGANGLVVKSVELVAAPASDLPPPDSSSAPFDSAEPAR